ncbi:tRNA cyclic N6-threonylcarbamoyladenosine(37) synthase TcdA [Paraferrimonas sp. SM1919]|uniref:tRNA cyclic N6-threonylcarbamoyladenosine(37) synthase TcdA n=1 Tax=Paraferrimonas sp. SM1919 TaxID=2662263 RepID=UPI0013D60C6A|nr:tRNA cyclic N6-threonylcarbamoyladenosine(37) synthase TcdA [Paraferrimonas sp. SM1919]
MQEQYLMRFGGIARLYGQQALAKFHDSHVTVVGIGGVGTWVAESLARSGIGQITLIDLDDICVTNTNRQIHALKDTIGHSKVEEMAARIEAINPDCIVNQIEDFVAAENLSELIHSAMDYVVDCIDSVAAKAALIAYCKRNKIKIVSVGGAGGQLDPRLIQVTDLAKTIEDPLMSKVRNILRRDHGFSKNPKRKFAVECVFSTEKLKYPQPDGSACAVKSTSEGMKSMDCSNGFGAVTHVTGAFAFFATSRVLMKLAER